MPSEPRRQLETWLKTIDVDAELVYDVGGAQLPIEGRTGGWNVGTYRIVDLGKPHEMRSAPNIVFDIELGDWELQYPELPKADTTFCIEVSEYWIDPIKAMKNLSAMTKERLLISFQFVYPVHNPVQYDSLRYTVNGIHRLAEQSKFKIKSITHRRDISGFLQRTYGMNGMRANSEFQQDVTGYLVEMVK